MLYYRKKICHIIAISKWALSYNEKPFVTLSPYQKNEVYTSSKIYALLQCNRNGTDLITKIIY